MAGLRICLLSLLLLVASPAFAAVLVDLQSSEGELKAHLLISGDTLLIDDSDQAQLTGADQLLCTLTVIAPEEMTVTLPNLNAAAFGDFTLLDQTEVTSRRTRQGLEHQRQWFIEPYNPGPYQLPELLIRGRHGHMVTELILPRPEFIVQGIESSSEDLTDILPPLVPAPSRALPMALATGTLALLALAIWGFIRGRNKGPKPLPPQERALAEMALVAELPPRQHMERLAFILRCYLDSRFELRCLEQTYDEYSSALAACAEIPEESRQTFLTILKQCDLVKFSNSDPGPDEAETAHQLIKAALSACPLASPDDKTCGRW